MHQTPDPIPIEAPEKLQETERELSEDVRNLQKLVRDGRERERAYEMAVGSLTFQINHFRDLNTLKDDLSAAVAMQNRVTEETELLASRLAEQEKKLSDIQTTINHLLLEQRGQI